MSKIKIIGKTNSQQINLVKLSLINEKETPFLQDEFFIIEDDLNNRPICRVIETMESRVENCEFIKDIISVFKNVNINEIENIYIAKARIEKEVFFPINSASEIRSPIFDEVKDLLYTCSIERGIPLGAIRGTEKLFNSIPNNWNNSCCFMKNGKIEIQDRAPHIFDYRKMEQFPHIGLFGGSGSGKTFAMKAIIEELTKKHIPMIVLDPHYEMGFEENIKDIPENLKYDFNPYVDIFYIGQNIGIDFSRISSISLVDILRFSGDITPPMEAAIYALHNQGDTFSKFKTFLDKLIDDFREFEVNGRSSDLHKKYSKGVAGLSTLNAISWRLNELNRKGVFTSDTLGIEKSLMKQKTCVVRGPITLLNIVGSYVANTVYEKRRTYIDGLTMKKDEEKFLPFIIIMDEAHCFAPSEGALKSPMNSILETISKEGRKYGIFEILATQRPKLMNPTISAQLSTKFIFRTNDSSDIATIRKETDLDEDSLNRLGTMEAGACFISSAINGKCISVKIKSNITVAKIAMSPFDELEEIIEEKNDVFFNAVKNILPIRPLDYSTAQESIEKELDTKFSLNEFISKLDNLTKDGMIKVSNTIMGNEYFL